MITYQDHLEGISPEMLNGFFEGWKNFPSQKKHYELLKNSSYIIIAIDNEKRRVAGFINAVSDGVLSAYIPLLEVIPEYRDRGIGSELMKRMLDKLKSFYMIDIVCDESLQSFYEKCGMKKHTAMILRNYDKQSGE